MAFGEAAAMTVDFVRATGGELCSASRTPAGPCSNLGSQLGSPG